MTAETIITGTILKKRFGSHAAAVLSDRLERQPRAKGEREKFKIVKDLPTVEEFNALRARRFTCTVDTIVDNVEGVEFPTMFG